MTVVRGYARTPYGELHYAECGSGLPVLLLHQTPRSWDEYREVLPLLGARYRAVAMDTLGMGASAPVVGEPSIELYAAAAWALCDALGVARVDVVGHHTGGVVALEMAASAPERVRGLVLSSTPWVDGEARERRRSRPPVDHVVMRPDGSHLAALWEGRRPYYPDRPELLDRFVRDALSTGDPEAGHRAVGRYRMEDRVAEVGAAAVLCVGHDADPFAYPDLPRLAERLHGAQTVVVPGGMVPLEHTAATFAEVVLEFLDDLGPG